MLVGPSLSRIELLLGWVSKLPRDRRRIEAIVAPCALLPAERPTTGRWHLYRRTAVANDVAATAKSVLH